MADKSRAAAAPPVAAPRPRKSSSGFVAHLVADPANPPRCVVVAGYLGDSTEANHTRVYWSPDLGDYAEVPDDAILHQMPVAGDPLGAVYLWILRSAEIKRPGNAG